MKMSKLILVVVLTLSSLASAWSQETDRGTEGPRFSPDGKQIVFTSTVWKKATATAIPTPVSGAIGTVNADGSNFKLLTKDAPGTWDEFASFSPDGRSIVFRRRQSKDATNRSDPGDIYMVNSDGTGLKAISTNTANEVYPEFNVGGKSVIFVRRYSAAGGKPKEGELVEFNLGDGSEQILIGREFRVTQAVPMALKRGALLVGMSELDSSGKPMPEGSMLAVTSPNGELNPRAFSKLPTKVKGVEIDRIVVSLAPTNVAFYVAASEPGMFGGKLLFKITPTESKQLERDWADIQRSCSLSPDYKFSIIGEFRPSNRLTLTEFSEQRRDESKDVVIRVRP